MAMTLRLDTPGLRAMIADNPTFQLEIQQAVINNIQQAVIDRVNGCLDKMVPKESYYGSARIIKDQRILEVINATVKAEVKGMLKEAIDDAVQSATHAIDLRVSQEVKKLAKQVLLESISPADAKAILLEKLV